MKKYNITGSGGRTGSARSTGCACSACSSSQEGSGTGSSRSTGRTGSSSCSRRHQC